MESRRKRSRSQILKWCCYVLGLFVCAALQTTPGLFQLGQAKPPLLLPPPSTLHTMSTAASASARISGLKRGFFGCKKINSSSWMNYSVRNHFS